MQYQSEIFINGREISLTAPTYFVADIASNHDGDIEIAKELIHAAKEAGADAVKFQHFLADKIVSDYGFRALGGNFGHQAKWGKSVYEVYKESEFRRDWTPTLAEEAKKAGIDFFTTPYDLDALEAVDPYVPAYKIGSGDITWTDFIKRIAAKGKPVLLATGASTMRDVERAMAVLLGETRDVVLMQCNTNYTGSLENFRSVNLRVLQVFSLHYPGLLLGLSDHTPGHAAVLGAIALGARVVEKHFTLDNSRKGPDHAFSMNPVTWREMVERARELELALGDGVKRVEENERETVVLQRRALRYARNIEADEQLTASDIECLRPSERGAAQPYEQAEVIGKRVLMGHRRGEAVYLRDLGD